METTRQRNRELWRKRVERWRDSDLTAAEFAAEIGAEVHTLKNWKYRLAKEAKARPAPRGKRRPSKKTTPRFVEVPTLPSSRIEIALGEMVIRVPVGFDRETLGKTLVVVREARR